MREIYENSYASHGDSTLFIAREDGDRHLFVTGGEATGGGTTGGEAYDLLQGERISNIDGKAAKRCPLTNENSKVIRSLFPFTNPVSHKKHAYTIGLGDRLGLASPGHLRAIKGKNIFPVLAQQSIRELTLTGRTYDDVLAAAAWAVFQEGYRSGYGADGDHLKAREEVKMALDCGFTMITLDCSEHIPDGLEAVAKFAIDIYNEFIRGTDIDFELSVDETQTVTTADDHRFIADALRKADVRVTSLAPRFPGEFQKGIDYRGDAAEFEKEFQKHAKIASDNGYKLSIHSGSDKFSVFPIIYRETACRVHLKTAGTHWLEALRTVARFDPDLFRKVCAVALEHLQEAKKYYYITENAANIPEIGSLDDSTLPMLLDNDDARQVLHITYEFTLAAHKAEIFDLLGRRENEHYDALEKRLCRHLPR